MDIQRLMKFLPPSLSLNFGSIYNPRIRVRVYNCGEGKNWLSMVENLSPNLGKEDKGLSLKEWRKRKER
jgi:hypothetical protein